MAPTAERAVRAGAFPLVFAAALLVKLSVLLTLGRHPLLQPAGDMDGAVYLSMARNGTPPIPYFVSPLYLYFLKIGGTSIPVALALQMLLGSLAVVLLFATSAQWFGRRAAILTAALAILTGVITFNEVVILQSSLDPFLVALSMWLLSLALLKNDWRLFAGAGVATALLALNRPNVLLWIATLAGLLLLQRHWKSSLAFAAGCLLMLAPVAARNLIVGHELVLVASHGGLNFYVGNHAGADGAYVAVPGIRPTIAGQSIDSRLMAEKASGNSLDSRGVSRWFYDRAFSWMRAHPLDALLLLVRKLAYTIHQTDLSLNFSYDFFSHDIASPLRFLIVGPWLLVPLGFAGAATLWRDSRFTTWFAFVPVYALSVAIFFVASRYRLPLLVVLSVAAGGVIHVRRPGQVMAGLLMGVVALLPFGLDSGRSQEQTNLVVSLIEHHQFDEAGRTIQRFEGAHRDPARLHHRAALAFAAAGESGRAASMFEQVLRDPVAQPILRSSATDALVASYVQSHRDDEARQLLAGIDPVGLSVGRAVNLGRLALQVRDGNDAITFLRVAVERDPANGQAWHHLGVALLAEGDAPHSIEALNKARALMPRDPPTFLFLALAHAQSGNVAEARNDATEALRLRPGFEQARNLLNQLGSPRVVRPSSAAPGPSD